MAQDEELFKNGLPPGAPTEDDADPWEDELADGEVWCPEPEPFEDFLEGPCVPPTWAHQTSVLPSQFTELAFRMPRADGLGYAPFSFDGRRHMRRIYDTPAKRILLFCGRQVEKSTLLGNRAILYSCLVQGFRTLYVSPSATQTKTFSIDRIKEPLETSHILKAYTTTALQQNVFEKQFVNRSKITLRYAFLNADRTRGIPAWSIFLDEFQDILSDNIPVIEQCASHAPEQWKRFIYAGTPKNLDNVIEYYRSGTDNQGRSMSTQGEWVVPCDACGSGAAGAAGRHWNVLGEKNIGKKSLICERCGKRIQPDHPEAQWAAMFEEGIYECYRIPQLMVPWKPWNEILLDYSRYSRDRFYNEVLGLSYDSGLRPLTKAQLRLCCNDDVRMHPDELDTYKALSAGQPIYAGIDWGTGENTYTVLVLATYVNGRFRVFYAHRFRGEEVDPPVQIARISEMLKYFNVRIAGCDYGGGFDRNDALVRLFGPARVQKYQYLPRTKRKVQRNEAFGRWQVHRTEVMSDLFNAIKRGNQIEFPRWAEFEDPYGTDMLNIFSEYNTSLRQIQYTHRPDRPDDTFHAVLYALLASMILEPRPDLITPRKEIPGQGPVRSNYTGPTDQG